MGKDLSPRGWGFLFRWGVFLVLLERGGRRYRLGGICPLVARARGNSLRSLRLDGNHSVFAQVVRPPVRSVTSCWTARWCCSLADRQNPGNSKLVVAMSTSHRKNEQVAHERTLPSVDLAYVRLVCPTAWTLHQPNLSVGGDAPRCTSLKNTQCVRGTHVLWRCGDLPAGIATVAPSPVIGVVSIKMISNAPTGLLDSKLFSNVCGRHAAVGRLWNAAAKRPFSRDR